MRLVLALPSLPATAETQTGTTVLPQPARRVLDEMHGCHSGIRRVTVAAAYAAATVGPMTGRSDAHRAQPPVLKGEEAAAA